MLKEDAKGGDILPLSSSSSIVQVSRNSRRGSIRVVGGVCINTCEIIDGSIINPKHSKLKQWILCCEIHNCTNYLLTPEKMKRKTDLGKRIQREAKRNLPRVTNE